MKQSIRLLKTLFVIIIFSRASVISSVSAQFSVSKKDTVPTQNSTKQPVYTPARLTTARPVIDGKLNDECWKKGTWTGNFTQWIPKLQ
jgi:hypothetical protein